MNLYKLKKPHLKIRPHRGFAVIHYILDDDCISVANGQIIKLRDKMINCLLSKGWVVADIGHRTDFPRVRYVLMANPSSKGAK